MVGLDRFHHVSALISGRFRRIHSSTHPQGCGTGGVLFLSINQSLSLFIFNFLHSVVRGISKKLSLITLRDREECFFLSFPGTQRTLRDQCPGIRWVPSSLCASLSIHQYFEWRPFFISLSIFANYYLRQRILRSLLSSLSAPELGLYTLSLEAFSEQASKEMAALIPKQLNIVLVHK